MSPDLVAPALTVDSRQLQRVLLPVLLALSLAAAALLDRRRRTLVAALRRRLLFGVPWGTLLTVLLVLAVYLGLQGGIDHWRRPTTIPFRTWSFFYPLGVVVGPFAHGSPGHLTGNLAATLAFAPVAEYAWGHYPRTRGSESFARRLTNPYHRILVVPVAAVAVGILTGVVSVGPIIGFSGVAFAFAGVALVLAPLRAVVALVAVRAFSTLAAALRAPTVTATAGPRFSSPRWAEIAVQGHAVGLLFGLLVGLALVRLYDRDRPPALAVWTGVALFAVSESLWAVYWFRGGGTFVLYRAAGLLLVFALAAVVAVAVGASARPLVGGGPAGESLRSIPRWQAAATVLVVSLAALAGPGAAVNLVTASAAPLPGGPVEVRDYEVTYAEGIENGLVSAVDVEAFGESTDVTTSGLIVRSQRRGVWLTAVSADRLAFDGRRAVVLGGVGWRQSVVAERRGWSAVGGNTTYSVSVTGGGESRTVYTSPAATAGPVVDGRTIGINATRRGFRVGVSRGNRTVSASIPGPNATRRIAGVTLSRDGRRLVARRGATSVTVARQERYS